MLSTTADAAFTFEIGGTAVTGGAITVAQSGSAAGDVDTAEPTAANRVEEDGTIEMITDGGHLLLKNCSYICYKKIINMGDLA